MFAHYSNRLGDIFMKPLRVFLAAIAAMAAPLSQACADQQFMFGRMFPDLPQYDAPSDVALTALTVGSGPLFDPNINPPTIPNGDNSVYHDGPCLGGLSAPCPDKDRDVPSFFTYFGQFVDHDMTLDRLPLPNQFVDPATIPNNRDPRLNLDSVYGQGPEANPELYEQDRKHLKTNVRDLPRKADGSAILFEGRNDENQVIAQIHVAFLRAHNALVDRGYNFERARELMRWRYQWIIVHQFLPEVLDPDTYADVFNSDGKIQTRYFDPKQAFKAVMPVEFSVAAFRFGHSQVRRAYILLAGCPAHCGDSANPKVQVFNPSQDDLRGGRPITAAHTIFWPNFLPVEGQPITGQPFTGQVTANISRKIDPLLSSGLFTLPIPGAETAGPSILALRNLQRARAYGLPSGQAVAAHMGNQVFSNHDIAVANPNLAGLENPAYKCSSCQTSETPLWLYILAEAKIVHNGAKLGPTGSRIVAEVIGGLLAGDVRSYYRRNWVPEGGSYSAQKLLADAGLLP
jgi:hypothetical protein